MIMLLVKLKEWRDEQRMFFGIAPMLFTFANAFFGLMSVTYTLDGQFLQAAYCIVVAAIFDGVDGKVARLCHADSLLGMELDSLCDAISFCFAPAILLYGLSLSSSNVLGMVVVGAYLCAGLFRLAKFNISKLGHDEYFVGLPTTIAALWISSFIIALPSLKILKFYYFSNQTVILIVVTFLALLMISSIKFPSFKRRGAGLSFRIVPFITVFTGICSLIYGINICFASVSAYIVSSCIVSVLNASFERLLRFR